MKARLPDSAKVKDLSRGEIPVSEVVPGQVLVGYSIREKKLATVVVSSVQPIPIQPHFVFHLRPIGRLVLMYDTGVYTSAGPALASQAKDHLYGFCILKPRLLSVRPIDAVLEQFDSGVEIQWDTDVMLWSQGIVVGSP
jgi:hypothetical protein